jgi:hypothetical protein
MLCKVQAAILERESALEKAAAEIESHQLELGDYDLIGCGSDSPDPETELAAHAIFAQKHKLARAAYELTKTQHVNIVAEVEALFNLCQLTK